MEIKDKFIVINRKHLKNLEIVPRKVRAEFNFALFELAKHIPDNKYWVCNQDEPYADKIIETILKGEDVGVRVPTTLREANHIRQQEWDTNDKITLSYRGNELAGEVGEACNKIKKLERERLGIRGSRATKDQLAEELADVMICIDLIAMHEGIDLDRAVRDKFNLTSEKYGLQTRLGQKTP